MATPYQTGFRTTLGAKVSPADTSIVLATAPTVTAGRMHLYNGQTHSWVKYTGLSGTTCTGCTFVSQTADPVTTVTGNTFPAGSNVELVEMHDQMLDKTTGILPVNGPRGFMDNGKISVTVAGNDITVALLAMDGSTPSATNPIYIRMGDAIRTVSAALSVTKAAGTNWFNSGSTEIATQEIDYFVYLGYDYTGSAVRIGFARIPYGTQYSSFSTTTTNEKYCAISDIATASSSDYYENIGRFAATLSAGAGYTWTVPTYTATNLINRPIYQTRNLSLVSTITANGSMTVTSPVQGGAYYRVDNDIVEIVMSYQFTLGGVAANELKFTIPFSYNQTVAYTIEGAGSYYNTTNDLALVCQMDNTTKNAVRVKKYDSSVYTLGASQDAKIMLRHRL